MATDDSSVAMGIPGPTAKSQPPQEDFASHTCIWTQRAAPIDITNGHFVQLKINKLVATLPDGTIKTDGTYYHINDIDTNYFLGLPNTNTNDKLDEMFHPILSGDDSRFYNYFKPTRFEVKFSNFTIYIERDQSGGIQLLDTIAFEIKYLYYDYHTQTANIVDSRRSTIGNLQQPLTLHLNVDCNGWFQNKHLIQSIGTDKKVVEYRDIVQLQQLAPDLGFTCNITTPPFSILIRPLNSPVTTNTKIWLNYNYQLTGHWLTKGKTVLSSNRLPLPGTAVPRDTTNWDFVKPHELPTKPTEPPPAKKPRVEFTPQHNKQLEQVQKDLQTLRNTLVERRYIT